MNSLFNSVQQLNYDEVVRRLKYWNDPSAASSARRESVVSMLLSMLERERKNLYFEEEVSIPHA